jgi:hypothetical protein
MIVQHPPDDRVAVHIIVVKWCPLLRELRITPQCNMFRETLSVGGVVWWPCVSQNPNPILACCLEEVSIIRVKSVVSVPRIHHFVACR